MPPAFKKNEIPACLQIHIWQLIKTPASGHHTSREKLVFRKPFATPSSHCAACALETLLLLSCACEPSACAGGLAAASLQFPFAHSICACCDCSPSPVFADVSSKLAPKKPNVSLCAIPSAGKESRAQVKMCCTSTREWALQICKGTSMPPRSFRTILHEKQFMDLSQAQKFDIE